MAKQKVKINYTRSIKQTKNKPKITNKLVNWDWFKRNYIDKEDPRNALDNTDLSIDNFIIILKRVGNWNLPNHCRQSKKRSRSTALKQRTKLFSQCYNWYLEIMHKNSLYMVKSVPNKGVGLFVRKSIRLKKDQTLNLTGYFLNFSGYSNIEKYLKSNQHPSLCDSDILYGPVALINHKCGQEKIGFTNSKILGVKNKHGEPIRLTGQLYVDYFSGKGCNFKGCKVCQ